MTDTSTTGRPIAAVERDTGIGRDTLRIWERRYGFPKPDRTSKGERVYPECQVRRLQLIRRLMDRGWRPGRIAGLDESNLIDLASKPEPCAKATTEKLDPLLEAVRKHEIDALFALLTDACDRLGLRQFILEVVAPAARIVGDGWAAGEIEIFEEHLFTRTVIRFLDSATSSIERIATGPPVLLTTLPGEPHSLGLMMVDALLCAKGRSTINLGAEVPLDQVAQAAVKVGANMLALSFSSSYPYAQIRKNLVELRSRIPEDILIWIGGSGARRLKRLPPGISRKNLEEL